MTIFTTNKSNPKLGLLHDKLENKSNTDDHAHLRYPPVGGTVTQVTTAAFYDESVAVFSDVTFHASSVEALPVYDSFTRYGFLRKN